MRDQVGRVILAALGAGALVVGVLGLAGVVALESRTATILVAIGALGNGAMIVRVALDKSRGASA